MAAGSLAFPGEFSDASKKTLPAHCFCKTVNFTVTVLTSALPLPVHLCHCTVCRYTHGTLCIFHAPLPKGVEPEFVAPSSRGALASYIPSNALSDRLFCKQCGCHIGDIDIEANGEGFKEWRVSSSIFEDHSQDLFQIRSHIYTDSSPGGGLFDWLPTIGERQLWIWPRDEDMPAEAGGGQARDQGGPMDDKLLAECHCGGVSFSIPRPDIQEVQGDEYLQKLASPHDKTKWVGALDLCDDCRLCDGTHVVGWVSIPLPYTSPRVPADLNFGTLKVFRSSEGVRRAFCGVCGATVFWSSEEEAPTEEQRVVDLATGILRAPDGVLARDWLTWRTEAITWESDGRRYDPLFCESLKKHFEAWGQKENN